MLRWPDVLRFAKYGNPEPPYRVHWAEEVWAQQLSPAQFQIMRRRDTEPPYRNAYCRTYAPGTYCCAGCGSILFHAATKYHAISGWPSFTQPAAKNSIRYAADDSHSMQRIEAICNVCESHLGHVFPDGPAPAGLRYCINSACLVHRAPEGDQS